MSTLNSQQNPQSNSAPSVENKITTPAKKITKKNNSSLIIGGVAGALVLAAIVAGVSMSGGKTGTQVAQKDQNSSMSSPSNSNTGSQVADSNPTIQVNTTTADGQNQTVTQPLPDNLNLPKPMTAAENLVKDERTVIDKYLEVKASNDKINLNPLTMTKEEAKLVKGGEVALEVKPDPEKKAQKFRYTLEYASAGDMDFEKGSLVISVDKALKIIPGSVKDTFNGQTIEVSDSIFKDNVAKYGPGSKDKEYSAIKVGQKGTITIDVEVAAGTAPGDYRIASVLNDLITGKPGMPSVFFLEVK
jgi:hypothetical protein